MNNRKYCCNGALFSRSSGSTSMEKGLFVASWHSYPSILLCWSADWTIVLLVHAVLAWLASRTDKLNFSTVFWVPQFCFYYVFFASYGIRWSSIKFSLHSIKFSLHSIKIVYYTTSALVVLREFVSLPAALGHSAVYRSSSKTRSFCLHACISIKTFEEIARKGGDSSYTYRISRL